jgi:AcrR family transcriptional regulator
MGRPTVSPAAPAGQQRAAARRPLDADAILSATEEVLRRYGPAKATVTDVARALGVSHTAVYQHFPSKAGLREAVTRRWLARDRDTLAAVAADAALPPPQRLWAWLTALFAAKRAKASEDPELFVTYGLLAAERSAAATAHVADLLGQLGAIIAAGVASGDFAPAEPAVAARAVFHATARFHDPAHAREWLAPGVEADLGAVCDLVLHGLLAGPGLAYSGQ